MANPPFTLLILHHLLTHPEWRLAACRARAQVAFSNAFFRTENGSWYTWSIMRGETVPILALLVCFPSKVLHVSRVRIYFTCSLRRSGSRSTWLNWFSHWLSDEINMTKKFRTRTLGHPIYMWHSIFYCNRPALHFFRVFRYSTAVVSTAYETSVK